LNRLKTENEIRCHIQKKQIYLFLYVRILYICGLKLLRKTVMGKTKLDIQKLEEAAKKLRAIAHPLRIAIIGLLEDNKSLSVTEIHEKLQVEQAITSHHLGILKDKGVLKSERRGKNIFYELKHSQISKIVGCINSCGTEQ